MADFLLEAANMCSVDHAHIVQLYGVVLSSDSLMLVTGLTIHTFDVLELLIAFVYYSLPIMHITQQWASSCTLLLLILGLLCYSWFHSRLCSDRLSENAEFFAVCYAGLLSVFAVFLPLLLCFSGINFWSGLLPKILPRAFLAYIPKICCWELKISKLRNYAVLQTLSIRLQVWFLFSH